MIYLSGCEISFQDAKMNPELLHSIDIFITNTSEAVSLRCDDSLLIIGPDKIKQLNRTGYEMLHSLYKEKASAEKTVELIHKKYGTDKDLIVRDLSEIVASLNSLMNPDKNTTEKIPSEQYSPANTKYPSRSEIALTYRCQNRCDFCSTSGSLRRKDFSEMSTDQAKLIIDKIHSDAFVPSISFTGGEPTMRSDLAGLVEYAVEKGMRTNLVTNGIKCSDVDFVKKLSASGLHSARVNIESHDEMIHNRITGNMESYKKTVSGIHNLIDAGIDTLTNTTLCRGNKEYLLPLVKFVKKEFNAKFHSMNMLIPSETAEQNGDINIGYSSIAGILLPLLDCCREIGLKLLWQSPTPYCMFNPVEQNLGSKSCKCVSGILSINPAGEVIPCSGYNRILGNLLKDSFNDVWSGDKALYFRESKFIPTVCKKCSMKILCKGACPLYWERAGSFGEIKKFNGRRFFGRNFLRFIERRLTLK